MLLEEIQQCTTNVWCIPMEVVQETEGITKFKESKCHMWIQATRDPRKAWIDMQYHVTRESIEWIIKDWLAQWKMLVEKLETKPATTQSTKPKG
jgi:hypothetical protein